MNAEHDLDRRLTKVENETVHVYNLIDERTQRLEAGISEVRTTLAEHSLVLAEHSLLLTGHGDRLARIDTTLDEILRRLPDPGA